MDLFGSRFDIKKTVHLAELVFFFKVYKIFYFNLLFEGFELIVLLVGWVGEGGFPGDWVGDLCGEVVVVEGAIPGMKTL
jgi:hypothetical protein